MLFAATGCFFVFTGCANPGVPAEPERTVDGFHVHPGPDTHTLSRDTNRYVRGFDHFCEFVGNDIGKGNLGYFVGFLVLLSLFCSCIVIASGAYVVLMWQPPPTWHLQLELWRVVLSATLAALLVWSLVKCWHSDLCAGVGPLIMMMPGMTLGVGLILGIVVLTVTLPLLSDMWDHPTATANPTAFFLILPVLCFAVLFWGMSIHWVWLLAKGLSQKVWLKAQGLRFGTKRPPPERTVSEAGREMV